MALNEAKTKGNKKIINNRGIMKKLLVFIVFLGLLGVIGGHTAQAEAPSGILGFSDGKFYDESQALKYMCFEDGNCYDLQGKFGFKRSVPAVAGVSTTTQPTIITETFKNEDTGNVVCQMGGTGNHNMAILCKSSRKTNVRAGVLRFKTESNMSRGTTIKVSTFGDTLTTQTIAGMPGQVFNVDINAVIKPSGEDYKLIAQVDSTNLDIEPFHLSLDMNGPFNTVYFVYENDYSYYGKLGASVQ